MAELLLELFSEEIPARMQARAAEELQRLICEALDKAGLLPDAAMAYVTPRRLALRITGLPQVQPDVSEERRGPRVGSPEKAIEGFLKSAGLASIDQAEQRDTGKGVFYVAVTHRKGRATPEVLAELLPAAFAALPWPKSMTWGAHPLRWVRPLHAILCLFAGTPVPLAFGHLRAGASTRGHRFMAPGDFAVKDFRDYRARLRSAYVMLDAADRRAAIRTDAKRAAADAGLSLVEDEGLLQEVAGLVEWPVVLMGAIDESFMAVPREVLTTAMRAHQKYFALQNADGTLAPKFLLVANLLARDGGAQIIAGNERVLRARLSDAKFFWDQDRKLRLESRVPALRDIIFHARLGTVEEKVVRMQTLAHELAAYIPGAEPELCRSAALLAKADLTSGMVGEFPELQGVMGRYYAYHDGEKPAVAEAIAEHYSPLGPNDRCPKAPVSIAVALADKIDTLVGFFGIDEKPTGSRDPFALRRAALGVIRLILENQLRLPLLKAFGQAFINFDENRSDAFSADPSAELLDFFADRLKVHLHEQGVRHDLVSAVFALGREDDLVRLLAQVEALRGFLGSDDGANLLVAYRRAANILRIEEKKDGVSYHGAVDPGKLSQPEERMLFERLNAVGPLAKAALAKEEFAPAGQALAKLRAPVDAFFDKVTVNAEDKSLRANRLQLLALIRTELDRLADFSKIEG